MSQVSRNSPKANMIEGHLAGNSVLLSEDCGELSAHSTWFSVVRAQSQPYRAQQTRKVMGAADLFSKTEGKFWNSTWWNILQQNNEISDAWWKNQNKCLSLAYLIFNVTLLLLVRMWRRIRIYQIAVGIHHYHKLRLFHLSSLFLPSQTLFPLQCCFI